MTGQTGTGRRHADWSERARRRRVSWNRRPMKRKRNVGYWVMLAAALCILPAALLVA